MPEVQLTAGTIDYEDTGGDGPVVVLLHGLAMDATVWRHVIADLRGDHRCIAPTLPIGSHKRPMRPDADLSVLGQARIVAEFLERLGLRDATVVANDLGTAQIVAGEFAERIGRLVLSSMEAFDNYPPGLPGRTIKLMSSVPGAMNLVVQSLRIRPLRRLPTTYGWMSKRRIPDEVMDGWLRPLITQRAIRRDLLKYLRGADWGAMERAAERLHGFDKPALVVWAAEDRVMPPEHGRRLAELLPQGRLVEIPDSRTLIPEDQPAAFAREIRAFVAEGAEVRAAVE